MIITSKYLGPTDSRGSRVATYSGAKTVRYTPWDHALDTQRNHERAAEAHYAAVMGKDAIPPNESCITTRALPDASNHQYVHTIERR